MDPVRFDAEGDVVRLHRCGEIGGNRAEEVGVGVGRDVSLPEPFSSMFVRYGSAVVGFLGSFMYTAAFVLVGLG